MLAARMLHKKSVYLVSGLAGGELKTVSSFLYRRSVFGVGATLLSSVLSCFEQINYSLADLIVAESPFLIHQISSSKHPFRPIVDGALFVDTECFSPKIELSQRAEVISYFGALAEHKGLMNFVEAVPQILKQRIDVKFTIGGGPESMLPVIERRVKELLGDENPAVVLLGRVAHAQMPNYLNETKLVVLPSYGEGLPNIVLEAMACGTPVLATRCGGIPDVIRDGENGFIMEDNSPQCIARNVIRSLNHPSLEEVALNARHLVERDYSHYSAEKRYRKILNEVSNMYK
jgi:glycosyltransferase involved in cell wall biosynthesis